jgi:hypothetical protein
VNTVVGDVLEAGRETPARAHARGVKMVYGRSVMGHMDCLDSQFAADGTKCEAARSFNPSVKSTIAANGDTG